MSLRIGLVSQWYDPEVGSAAVPGTIARALRGRGHDVSVLTGFPNYPSGDLYPGYRVRPYRREVLDGVPVHRAPLYASHDERPVRRAANYLTFAAGATAVGLSRLRDRQAMLVYWSPATAAVPAMALRRLARVPYVLLIQDMWPQSVTESGFLSSARARRATALLHRFCDTAYRGASSIAVISPGMADLVAARGVDARRIEVIPNWVDEQLFRPGDPSAFNAGFDDGRFTVMFAGNLGEMQGLNVVTEAATLLRERDDIGFVLVGDGVARRGLEAAVSERGLTNVSFVPPQSVDRMADVLAAADVQLVSLKDTPLLRVTMPSKIQATLASGRAVIGAVAGDAARTIEASGAGITVPPGDATALARAVVQMRDLGREALQEMGSAGRAYYVRELSQASGSARLEQLLAEAADDQSRVGAR
jgi:glycosyltransferase involved in cell wall biosynthesis